MHIDVSVCMCVLHTYIHLCVYIIYTTYSHCKMKWEYIAIESWVRGTHIRSPAAATCEFSLSRSGVAMMDRSSKGL